MRKFILLLVLCSLNFVAFSQAWNYNNNRIAISFDGNSAADNEYKWPTGDPDDWGAAAASCAIIAKLKLQDKLVHCSYNNFIDAPAGPDNENQLKISLEGATERWGFNPEIFIDVTTHLNEARSHLAKEIAKSTAEDPLYLCHAGLTEFIYQVAEEVIETGHKESLKHLFILSHSGFNENEKRRPQHRDFDNLRDLCDNQFNYKKIKDQNDKTNPDNLWNSGKDFSVWYWMRDHNDPNIKWMYERMEVHSEGVADISDCGMLFYLLLGDDNGNPEKFREFIGDGIE
jgi:hypothetical protein